MSLQAAHQETKLCARKREVVWARGKDIIQAPQLTSSLPVLSTTHFSLTHLRFLPRIVEHQGALITMLASKHLSAADKARIEVLTFGAAQSVDASAGFKRAINYYAMNDPVLYVDVAAARAWSFLDKSAVDAAMASRGSSVAPEEADEVDELEALLQRAVKQRRWHACVQIQAALDVLRGQVRVPMQAGGPADAHNEVESRGLAISAERRHDGMSAGRHVDSQRHASKSRARAAMSMRFKGEAELVFCRPVSGCLQLRCLPARSSCLCLSDRVRVLPTAV